MQWMTDKDYHPPLPFKHILKDVKEEVAIKEEVEGKFRVEEEK